MRVFLISFLLVFTQCKKKDTLGTVLITVKHLQAPAVSANIYMKSGTRQMPAAGTPWDKQQTANSSGQCYFTDLQNGDYYFYAEKIDGTDTLVSGKPVTVAKGAAVPRYEILLDIN